MDTASLHIIESENSPPLISLAITHFYSEDYALSHNYCFIILATTEQALSEEQLTACFATLHCQQQQKVQRINGIITTVSMLEKTSRTTRFTYRLTLQSVITHMALNYRVRSYSNLSSKDIIQQLLAQSQVQHLQLNYCALKNQRQSYFYQNHQSDLDCFHSLIANQGLIYTIEHFHQESRLTLNSSLTTLNPIPSSLLQTISSNGIADNLTTCSLVSNANSHLIKNSRVTTVLNNNVALQLGQHILLDGKGFYLIAKSMQFHAQQFSQKLSLLADDADYSLPQHYGNKQNSTFVLAKTPTNHQLDQQGKYTLHMTADNHCGYDSVSEITFTQLQLGSHYGFHFPLGDNSEVLCANLHNQELFIVGAFNTQHSTDNLLSSNNHQLRIEDKPHQHRLQLQNSAHQLSLQNTPHARIALESKQGSMSIRSSAMISCHAAKHIHYTIAQFQRCTIDERCQFITDSGNIELQAKLNIQFKSLDTLTLKTYQQQLGLSAHQLLLHSTESLRCHSTQGDIRLEANKTLTIKAHNNLHLQSKRGSITIQSGTSSIKLCEDGNIYLKAENINVASESLTQQQACLTINQ